MADTSIKTSREFGAVKKGGICVRAGHVLVAALPGASHRLGIVVSRRVGGAVDRNRIKRVVRAFFRCNLNKFPKADCVVIPAAGAGKLTNDEIRRDLIFALKKMSGRINSANEKSDG